MNHIRFWIVLGGLLLVAPSAFGQMKGWELGAWAGGSNYFGDLNTNWRINRTQLAGGAVMRYNFNDRLALRFGLSAGSLSATDSDSKNVFEQRRNLSFKTALFDGGAFFEFNFLPYVHGHRDYYYTPFVFVGPAFFNFSPKAELNGETYKLREYGTEGQFRGEEYNSTQGALAYGVGFKLDLSYRWSINVEVSGRKLFTDYLDDVSGNYADPSDLISLHGDVAAALADRSVEPKIGAAGRQRGNGKSNDMYVFAGVGLVYYFGQIRCPEFLR
ncbi:MAG: hypothetical protein IPL65_15650 [Lewinellaceae bacterium]|nr:hypothetical protein [Lewinellaceae bacterium]